MILVHISTEDGMMNLKSTCNCMVNACVLLVISILIWLIFITSICIKFAICPLLGVQLLIMF